MLVSCPECKEKFPVIGGGIVGCVFCGARMEVRLEHKAGGEAPVASIARQLGQEYRAGGLGLLTRSPTTGGTSARTMAYLDAGAIEPRLAAVAWEAPHLKLFERMEQTLQHIFRRPRAFFRALGDRGFVGPLAFMVVTAAPGLMVQAIFWDLLHPLGVPQPPLGWWALVPPFLVALGFLPPAYYWLLSRRLSPRKVSYQKLVRANGFAWTPLVLGVLPGIGLVVGAVWSLALQTLSLRMMLGWRRSVAWASILGWSFLLLALFAPVFI